MSPENEAQISGGGKELTLSNLRQFNSMLRFLIFAPPWNDSILKNAKDWNISKYARSVPGMGERRICHSPGLSYSAE
jgi:hypothetical protein